MLGIRRLLIVDQAPEAFEDLLADQSGEKPGEDAERCEQELDREPPHSILNWRGVSGGRSLGLLTSITPKEDSAKHGARATKPGGPPSGSGPTSCG